MTQIYVFLLLTMGACTLAGCATSMPASDGGNATTHVVAESRPTTGPAVARAALDLLGTPYRYGGSDRDGLDCSGLVQLAHARIGVQIPRTTSTQYQAARKVSDELRIGDVLFFKINGRIAHNGIYLGNNRFIHAPSTGKNVTITRTDNPYFSRRLAGVRRFR
ncbi:MAG: C40 family peptidase [Gammaproteobacteria bacterium]|nr:C40 family peptidase [Gammaproteobacteria bacterium]NNF66094.1 C40 family peptidase [Gammaproteobacteria bacterium]